MWKSKAKQLSITLLVGVAILGTLMGIPGIDVDWPTASRAAEAVVEPLAPQTNLWTTRSADKTALPEIDIAKLNQAFTSLAKTMSPSVVNIFTKTGLGDPWRERNRYFRDGGDPEFFFNHPFRAPNPRQAQALGSGFVINTDGYIVTNAHVVRMAGRNADEIMVQFIGEDYSKGPGQGSSRGHEAKIVGVDEATDVALLKLVKPISGLVPAPLGDSERLEVGEWVVAIGNPYGHTHTFTQGVVSAVGRSLEGLRTEFIQTSASINPGNSGGPLINLRGEVVAINTAIDPRAQGIGFAIPINSAKSILTQLMTNGRVMRGWLGVGIQDAATFDGSTGVLVRQVMRGEPADRAGVRPQDVITSINGQNVQTTKDLSKAVENLGIGQVTTLEVRRGEQKLNLKVEISEPRS